MVYFLLTGYIFRKVIRYDYIKRIIDNMAYMPYNIAEEII